MKVSNGERLPLRLKIQSLFLSKNGSPTGIFLFFGVFLTFSAVSLSYFLSKNRKKGVPKNKQDQFLKELEGLEIKHTVKFDGLTKTKMDLEEREKFFQETFPISYQKVKN